MRVRATNGAGMTSSVATESRGVVFDPTPPTTPGEGSFGADTGTELYAMGMMPMIAYRPPWPVVAEAPAYTGSIPPASSGETTNRTGSWNTSYDSDGSCIEYGYVDIIYTI